MSLASKLSQQANALKAGLNPPPLSVEDTIIDKEESIMKLSGLLPQEIVAPVGSYIAKRQGYLITKNGNKVFPTNGYYVPNTQEEYDLLEYFDALKQDLVVKVLVDNEE